MTHTTSSLAKLYIGIDIHKRSWKVKLASDLADGRAFTCPPKAESLKAHVDKFYKNYEVFCAYEAGCCGYGAHREFVSYGWHSIVFNPADISRTGTSQYQKTDAIDAKLICRELKDGRLRCIKIPDTKREELRALFRHRNNLVKDMRRIKSRIKMQLLFLGIEIPENYDKPKWSHAFRNWIKEVECYHPTGDYLFETLMIQYDQNDELIRNVSTRIRAYCRKHYKKDYYLLRSLPGVGGIVACAILSELGDLREYRSNKQLAAYVGLMPRIHQSADKVRMGGITPRAKHIVRSLLIESAWQAIRADPVMLEYYRKHSGKESKRIIIKIARKLLNRARAVVKNEIPYEIGVIQ